MRRTFKYFCLTLITVLVSIPALAQIGITLPDTTMVEGDTLLMPVVVDSSLTGSDVLSLQMGFTFTESRLSLLSVEKAGSMTEDWEISTNMGSGEVHIAAAGETALAGTGVLLYLRFRAKSSGGTYVYFKQDETFLNEGSPALILYRSYISITARPEIYVSNPVSQLVVGDSAQYAVGSAEGAVSWSTTDPGIASISPDGLMRALSPGYVSAIAEDSRGIIDTSNSVKVFGFRLSANDTTNYQGQEVSVNIHTTDLTPLDVKSGEFFLSTYLPADRFEVISVEPGELLSAGAMIDFNLDGGYELAFAQSESIVGAGHLLTLNLKLKDDVTFNNTFSFSGILFNESIEGLGRNFSVRSIDLPAISVSPNSVNFAVGDSIQYTVTNSTGWVNWAVSNTEVASINDDGILVALKGGETDVSVIDSIGAVGMASASFYDVEAIIPDTSMLLADTIYVPIRVTNVEVSNSKLLSTDIEINFDYNRLDYLGYSLEGSLSSSWFYTQNILDQNTIKLVGADSDGIEESGDLLYLIFKADTSIHADTYGNVGFENILLNEGSPIALTSNGRIFISTKPLTPQLISPENGTEQVTLSPVLDWGHAVGADSYDVQLSTSAYFNQDLFDTTEVLTDELQVDNLTQYTSYYWRVRAVNEGGASNWSNSFWFKTQVPVPEAPVLNAPEDGAINQALSTSVSWINTVYAEQYRVEVDTSSNFTSVLIDSTVAGNVYNLLLPGLMNDVTYYWRVFASNATGESVASEVRMFTTIVDEPAIPILLSPSNGAVDIDTLVYLSWNIADRAESYTYQLATVNDFSTGVTEEVVIDTLTNAGGLDFTTEYFWRVRATNIAGQSDWSQVFSFTTRIPDASIPVLVSPANNAVEVDTALTFDWQDAEYTEAYHFQLSSQVDFLSLIADSIGLITSEYVIDGLGHETAYFWRVRSIGLADTSNWSSVFTFTTVPKLNHSPEVQNPLGSIQLSEDFSTILAAKLDTVFFDPEGMSLSYQLIRFDTTLFTAELTSDTLYLSSVLNQFGSGQVIVEASDGESDPGRDTLYVNVESVNDLPVISGLPDTLFFRSDELIEIGMDTVMSDIEDDLSMLSVSMISEPAEIAASYDPENYLIFLTAPGFSGEGLLTIGVTDSNEGYAETSLIIMVELSISTEGESGIPESFGLYQNYPNPFNPTTQINFDLPEAAKVRIEVFSMLGQKVATLTDQQFNAGRHQVRFDAATLSSGIYIYRLKANDFVQTKSMTLIK